MDKDYEGREADLIYKVNRADGEELYVFILQELQSTVDCTMIFRVLVYVVNNLLRYFLNTPKTDRERKDFRLPPMVPIVFYNGEEEWTAVRQLKDYQKGGETFGNYVLNLEYHLVNLSAIEAKEILSTNTVIDNIMYCDKYRKKLELAEAVKVAYNRIQLLGSQEKEEFNSWVKSILLSICGDKESVLEEILNWAGNGVDDMTFKYNIIKAFEDEREEGKVEGKAEAIIDLLEEVGNVSEELRQRIKSQKDMSVLKIWLKEAARADSIESFERNFM